LTTSLQRTSLRQLAEQRLSDPGNSDCSASFDEPGRRVAVVVFSNDLENFAKLWARKPD
jgi:hypothetical protein